MRVLLIIAVWPSHEDISRGNSEMYDLSGAIVPMPDWSFYRKYNYLRKEDDGFIGSTGGRPIAPRGR